MTEQHDEGANGVQLMQIILLLMDPITRLFELIQLEFKLKAVVTDILKKVPRFVNEEALGQLKFSGLCDCKGKELYSSTRLSDVCTGLDILIALPENFDGRECVKLARPILTDENVIEMFESIGVDVSILEAEPEIPFDDELKTNDDTELEPETPENNDSQGESEEKSMTLKERMASIKAQQEAFAQKGRSTGSSTPQAKKGSFAAQRMASIKAQQAAFAQKGKPSENSSPQVGRGNLAAQRMASIKAQQTAFAQKGTPSEKSKPKVGRGNLAAERMASIRAQQEAFAQKGTPSEKSNPEIGKGNVAAERMAAIKAQQEAFAQKGTPSEKSNPEVGRGNVAAEAMASIKAQQEAFANKGTPSEKSNPEVGRGNVAAEAMASIRAQQEAFANKGKPSEFQVKDQEASVSKLATLFSGRKEEDTILETPEECEEEVKEENTPPVVDIKSEQKPSQNGTTVPTTSKCACIIL